MIVQVWLSGGDTSYESTYQKYNCRGTSTALVPRPKQSKCLHQADLRQGTSIATRLL